MGSQQRPKTDSPIHPRGPRPESQQRSQRHPHNDDHRLTIAATLVAATGAARHPQRGIRNPTAWLNASAAAVLRAHAQTWRATIAAHPNATAEDLAYAVTDPYHSPAGQPATIQRTLDDGTQQRFLPATGWVTITRLDNRTNPDDEPTLDNHTNANRARTTRATLHTQ